MSSSTSKAKTGENMKAASSSALIARAIVNKAPIVVLFSLGRRAMAANNKRAAD